MPDGWRYRPCALWKTRNGSDGDGEHDQNYDVYSGAGNGGEQAVATASAQAAAAPKVHLGVYEGEQFLLGDLLYSLMLESHNDAAVMIAETISGSIEGFAALMNEKAAVIGCTDTHFVTPNGLDASDAGGDHHTTAADLARIMRYCAFQSPCHETFLKITRTASRTIQDESGKRSFYLANHNALLSQCAEVLSGKTGFTGKAGYCYVAALKKRGKSIYGGASRLRVAAAQDVQMGGYAETRSVCI